MARHIGLNMRGELISLPDFGSALEELAVVLEEVDRAVCGRRTVTWAISDLSHGSALVELTPELTSPDVIDRRDVIVTACIDGLEQLDARAEQPEFFSDRALKAAQSFARVADRVDAITMTGVAGERPVKRVPITQRLVANVATLISDIGQYSGALEGNVEVVSIHRGYAKESIHWGQGV